MSDACINGIVGVIAQGRDWKTARIAAFCSTKMTSTQQNYPVHEQEMLAGVEGMLCYHNILQGTRFMWLTDHKGLIHLYKQKNLSGRQACWLEKISEFDFEIEYIPGVENVLPDTLSRMYSNDAPGTVRVASEYTQLADVGIESALASLVSMPVMVGLEAGAVAPAVRASARPNKGVPRECLDPVPSAPGPSRAPSTSAGISRKHQEQRGNDPLRKQRRGPLLPVETGRLETTAEFAKQVRNRFILRGPHERPVEGEWTDHRSQTTHWANHCK